MPPRLARLLAAVVAIALVAGAFALRGALSGDDEGTTTGGGTGDPRPDGTGPDASTFRLICDEDLGTEVCAAVGRATGAEIEVRAAAEVIDPAVAGDDVPADAWLTLDGLPEALDRGRSFAGLPPLVAGPPTPVASSPLALLALPDPIGGCEEEPAVAWTCLVAPPATLRPGLAVPSSDTAVGILALAAGAAGLQGRTDFGIGAYEGTEEADRLEQLLDESPGPAGTTTQAQTGALFNPGTASGAVTVAGLAQRQAGTVRGGGRGLRVVPLDPPITVGVALVGLGPAGADALDALAEEVTGQTVRDALIEAGWDGDPARSSGLPEPDVVYALREELG